MSEFYTIGAVSASKTQAGARVIDLWSHDTRLKYPVLRLFDLSALLELSINPDQLTDEKHPCRFRAYYTTSEKTSANGNPYKDITHLEPIIPAADLPAVMNKQLEELGAEVRRLRYLVDAYLPAIAEQLEVNVTMNRVDWATGEVMDLPTPARTYQDGETADPDNAAECYAFDQHLLSPGTVPESRASLREYITANPIALPKTDHLDDDAASADQPDDDSDGFV